MSFRFFFTPLLLVSLTLLTPYYDATSNSDNTLIQDENLSIDSLGNLILKGKVDEIENGVYIKIYETEGRDFFLLDSALIEQGEFRMVLKSLEPGIYKIGKADDTTNLGEIILNPKEESIEVYYQNPNFNSGLAKTNSFENEALNKYQAVLKTHQTKMISIRRSSNSNEEKQRLINEEESDLRLAELELAKQYPGTYFAKMAKLLHSPQKLNKDVYWDDIDFSDKTLIHSTVYPSRIEDYMQLHASKVETKSDPFLGFYNAVDEIASRIKNNGSYEVLQFVLYTMSEGFYSSGMEELSLYVIDNYFYGDACGDAEISELFKLKAAGIRNLQIGSTTPDFSITDSKNENLHLNSIVKQNQNTLLLFWSSTCHRCQQEIPKLKLIYDRGNIQNFEVVAISVDSDYNHFSTALSSQGTTWPNACDTKGWRGPITTNYRVTSTPVMFLLNEDRKVILKPKNTSEIEAYLKK